MANKSPEPTHSLTIRLVSDQIYVTADLVVLELVEGKWVPKEPVLCFVGSWDDTAIRLRQVSEEVKAESKKVAYVDFKGGK